MNSIQEFAASITKDVKDYLLKKQFDNVQIIVKNVDKLQTGTMTGMKVRTGDSRIAPIYCLDDAYKRYEEGESYHSLLEEIVLEIQKELEEKEQRLCDFSYSFGNALNDYEEMKKSIMIQIVSTERNKDVLKTMPHTDVEDLSIIYKYVFDNKEEGQLAATITNNMLEQLHITKEKLHADALSNTAENFPYTIEELVKVLLKMRYGEEYMNMNFGFAPMDTGIYIASCNDGVYGAGCIFTPGFFEYAKSIIGEDYYILPSSVHECLLIGKSKSPCETDQLITMVKEINIAKVLEKDRLSDSVYYYSSETGFKRV